MPDQKNSDIKSGEAGHQGRDRQPAQGAGAGQVQSRSEEAGAMQKNANHDRSDMVHPGPDREEGEKSKGDAHHNQRETEKHMKTKKL
jgi:hypothetical protein